MRKLFALVTLSTLILTVAPATVAQAADSPIAETVTDPSDNSGDDEDQTKDPGSNDSDTSPQTGASSLAFIALVGAAGIALVSGKKITE